MTREQIQARIQPLITENMHYVLLSSRPQPSGGLMMEICPFTLDQAKWLENLLVDLVTGVLEGESDHAPAHP